jgi:hypothetical protein
MNKNLSMFPSQFLSIAQNFAECKRASCRFYQSQAHCKCPVSILPLGRGDIVFYKLSTLDNKNLLRELFLTERA